jgi:beta-xylosidase
VGFYDGSASHAENYEERCGIAVSSDLFSWRRISTEKPWLVSQHGSGSVRYADAMIHEGEWWIYYEMTRPDGAHELRLARVPAA